ncbi:hypothetical protein DFQ26_009763 [Actinomortierella ambigua]|nr:hypothetical protein DFQ26_009763 [Actinomortierella ambigua]
MFSGLCSLPSTRKSSGTAGALRVEGARASSEEAADSRGLFGAQTIAATPNAGGLHTNGSSAIYIPNDHRISQVLVTFKDGQHTVQQVQSLAGPNATTERTNTASTEATTVYNISRHFEPVAQSPVAASLQTESYPSSSEGDDQTNDYYLLDLSPSFSQSIEELSGESFGDMVLKHVDQVVPPPNDISVSDSNSAQTTPALTDPKAKKTFDPFSASPPREAARARDNTMASLAKEAIPNPGKIRATDTKASLALSSDTSSSERSVLSDASSSFSTDAIDTDERTKHRVQVKQQQTNLPPSSALSYTFGAMETTASETDPAPEYVAMVATSPTSGDITPPNQHYSNMAAHTRHHHHQLQDIFFSEEDTFEAEEDEEDNEDDAKNRAVRQPRASFSEGVNDAKERAPAAVLKRFSHPVVPVRRSSMTHLQERALGQLAEEDEHCGDMDDDTVYQQEHDWDSNDMEGSGSSGTYHPSSEFARYSVSQTDGNVPVLQPNSSDSSHSISSMATQESSDTRADVSDSNIAASPSTSSSSSSGSSSSSSSSQSNSKSKTSLASLPLQYWRSRQSSSSANDSMSSSPSFTQQILPFGKKKSKIQIPTIVLHPDEDDDEPPRVLSAKDIEYLSTMPPPPLRPLAQPWDDYPEEEEEEDINGGYDYDDYHDSHPQDYAYHLPQHHQHSTEQQHHHHHQYQQEHQQHHHHPQEHPVLHHELDDGFNEDLGCNPYAFDVPIDLPPELQDSLDREEVKIGYGYI